MPDDQNPRIAKTQTKEADSTEHTRSGTCFRPNVDIVELPDELVVLADMPGTTSQDTQIDFESGTLTIHARVAPRQPQGTEYLLHEYDVGDFFRTFQVSEAIDANHITAEYANGVLTLHLPKAEAAKPRKIQVRS